jgi:hypothetical protein
MNDNPERPQNLPKSLWDLWCKEYEKEVEPIERFRPLMDIIAKSFYKREIEKKLSEVLSKINP